MDFKRKLFCVAVQALAGEEKENTSKMAVNERTINVFYSSYCLLSQI